MHITREEFYDQLAKLANWELERDRRIHHRLDRITTWMETTMGILTDDLGALAGLVNQFESALADQKTKIDALAAQEATLEGQVTAQAPDHQELLDSHNTLSSLVQGMRDALAAAAPAEPPVVTPAPGDGGTPPIPVDPGTPPAGDPAAPADPTPVVPDPAPVDGSAPPADGSPAPSA